MPLPKPTPQESRQDFIARCMGNEVMNNEYPDNAQRMAVCSSQWQERSMKLNDKLLQAIKARGEKQTEFNYGILTADRYVRTVRECVGLEACYKYATCQRTSFQDVLDKAAKTLVYSNEDMVRESLLFNGQIEGSKAPKLDGVEMPKNTLMVFKHILTTPRKDRDGDILRTQGATVDPKMPLLWQHVHTLPIGKMLAIAEHTDKKLSLVSCIVDMNELSHDAAVMIEAGMGRFSHGFRALNFTELKEEPGQTTGPNGFDIKEFEIMEASLVSVPSNTDAETEDVLMHLVGSGKLTSPIMKEVGKSIKERQPTSIPVTKEIPDENEPGSGSEEETKQGCTCSSKQKDGETKEAEEASDKEVIEEKAGRTLSAKNLAMLKEVYNDMKELMDKEQMSRGGSLICKECMQKLQTIIEAAGGMDDEEEPKQTQPSVKDAMAIVLSSANLEERQLILDLLQSEVQLRKNQELVREYHALQESV